MSINDNKRAINKRALAVLTGVLTTCSARATPRDSGNNGNNLCVDPKTLPVGMTGFFQPIDDPTSFVDIDGTSVSDLALRGTMAFLLDPKLQGDSEKVVMETCGVDPNKGSFPNVAKDVRKSIKIHSACVNYSTGRPTYKIQSTFKVPCSKENIAKLPGGNLQDVTITTQAVVYAQWAANEGLQESVIESVEPSDLNKDYTNDP